MIQNPKTSFRIDLHVHTSRYSPCAETLKASSLGHALRQFDLHGLVIAEHNYLWSPKEIQTINQTLCSGRIYGGVEVACREGHFILIGLKSLAGFESGMPLKAFLGHPKPPSVAVIWAHPLVCRPPTLPLVFDDRLHGVVDAVEVYSNVSRNEVSLQSHAFAEAHQWHKVAGSDAHAFDSIGFAHTLFPSLPPDEKTLAEAIRTGPVWPVCRGGDPC